MKTNKFTFITLDASVDETALRVVKEAGFEVEVIRLPLVKIEGKRNKEPDGQTAPYKYKLILEHFKYGIKKYPLLFKGRTLIMHGPVTYSNAKKLLDFYK